MMGKGVGDSDDVCGSGNPAGSPFFIKWPPAAVHFLKVPDPVCGPTRKVFARGADQLVHFAGSRQQYDLPVEIALRPQGVPGCVEKGQSALPADAKDKSSPCGQAEIDTCIKDIQSSTCPASNGVPPLPASCEKC